MRFHQVKMASQANQEQSSLGDNSLTMQRQQQDLVKLLAQHFHHQFYQLTNNGGQLSGTATTTMANSRLRSQMNSAFSAPVMPYGNEQAASLGSNGGVGFDFSGMNMVTGASSQSLYNHILRSQATSTGHLGGAIANGAGPTPESLIDFSLRNSLNPYSLNDINLLHALGLNLTNNQLVLSLQQQQNTAQAQALRQYESRNETIIEQSELGSVGRCNGNDLAINNLMNSEDNHSDGKEMLKFSISTILGQGSPQPKKELDSSKSDSLTSEQISDMKNSMFGRANDLLKIKRETNSNERDERLSATECDSNDSCSDSSLIDASTSIPQQSNSILFNQTLPSDHRNTHMNGAALLASNQPPPQRNLMQAHHRPAHPNLPFLPGSSAFPWTVAARGKPRRGMMRRAVFSDSQRVGLEKRFQLQKYISKPDRKKLAEKLGLRDSQVKIWFQNRRMKWRNSKERELLSAGGSREQTLPTRNNPNPDLSDVGETIKRLSTNNSQTNNELMTNK